MYASQRCKKGKGFTRYAAACAISSYVFHVVDGESVQRIYKGYKSRIFTEDEGSTSQDFAHFLSLCMPHKSRQATSAAEA